MGRLRQDRRKSDEQNHTDYVLASFVSRDSRKGRIRVYEMLKRAEDTIADNLVQWDRAGVNHRRPVRFVRGDCRRCPICWPPRTPGSTPCMQTCSSAHRGCGRRSTGSSGRPGGSAIRRSPTRSTQRATSSSTRLATPSFSSIPSAQEGRNGRQTSGFVGMINKAEYVHLWRSLLLNPRFKSELLRVTPFSRSVDKRRRLGRHPFPSGGNPGLPIEPHPAGVGAAVLHRPARRRRGGAARQTYRRLPGDRPGRPADERQRLPRLCIDYPGGDASRPAFFRNLGG